MKRLLDLGALIALVLILGLTVGGAYTQERAAFRQPDRIAARINNDTARSVVLLADTINAVSPENAQAILDAIEAAFVPEPSAAERRAALARARLALLEAGLADDAAALSAVDAELDRAVQDDLRDGSVDLVAEGGELRLVE